jgi:tetratricopeptide (TPR) repeat protein
VKEIHPEPPNEQRMQAFREAWPAERVHSLLDHDEPVVRQCAAIALGHVGKRGSVSRLIDRLRDPSDRVRAAADEAIWEVWFNLGSDQANRLIDRAKRHARQRDYGEAIALMDEAIDHEPEFAEAYNQRAIIYFQMGEYAESAADCRRVLKRMPRHYGALSGLGQCLMRMGRHAEALETFRRTRKINPNLNLDGAIEKLKERLDQRGNQRQAV